MRSPRAGRERRRKAMNVVRGGVAVFAIALLVPLVADGQSTGNGNNSSGNTTHTGPIHQGEPLTNHPGGNPGWMRSPGVSTGNPTPNQRAPSAGSGERPVVFLCRRNVIRPESILVESNWRFVRQYQQVLGSERVRATRQRRFGSPAKTTGTRDTAPTAAQRAPVDYERAYHKVGRHEPAFTAAVETGRSLFERKLSLIGIGQ